MNQLDQVEGDLAGQVHHAEPGEIGKHGQAEQEQRQKNQRAALHVQRMHGQIAQAGTEHAATGALHAGGRCEVNIAQRCAGKNQEYQADAVPGKQPAVPVPGLIAGAKHLPGLGGQQEREDVGEVTQRAEQCAGEPGADAATGIHDAFDLHAVVPRRVGNVIGQQCHQQVQAHSAQGDQRAFLQSILKLLTPVGNLGGGILQNSHFLRPWRVHLMVNREAAYCRASLTPRPIAKLPHPPRFGVA